jgi:hypothetical protein
MNEQELCGWIDNPPAVEQVLSMLPQPLFQDSGAELIRDVQDDKPVLLYKFVRLCNNGKDAPAGPQKIGDCVSFGWAALVNYIEATQIALGQNAAFEEICTEAMYALARVEVGGQKGSYQDGAVGAWAAKAVVDFGTISRVQKLPDGTSLGAYDPKRAKDWGARGLPDNLEPTAKTRTVKTVSMVKSFDEAKAAIINGYGIAVCSNRGFTMTRDKQGFCKPSGVWNHCMFFCGYRPDRPGLCCAQSWGPETPSGPLDLEQPANTFWVDAEVADGMLRQRDSFTGSQYQGEFKPQPELTDWTF